MLHLGQIVEEGPADALVANPRHPYTRLLVSSLPEVGVRYAEKELTGIPGRPPSLLDPPTGCRFRSHCPLATARCEQEPPWVEEDGRGVACWEAAPVSVQAEPLAGKAR